MSNDPAEPSDAASAVVGGRRTDRSFAFDIDLLTQAVRLLGDGPEQCAPPLPDALPEIGKPEQDVLAMLAPLVIGAAARLGDPLSFAHMDPPTPAITWATTLWNASLNQNLLHPATAPAARAIEERVVRWLCPFFGMDGGHLVPGSTIANLTALWAAREAGATEVVASATAHLSIAKAANILGLPLRRLPVDGTGHLRSLGNANLSRSCLVLVAGSTSTGAIDPLAFAGSAAWTHVDAAWAGPLRLSQQHAPMLDGIEQADSVAVSAHKWLFQPKESALILFRDTASVTAPLTFAGPYLKTPNIGLLGSHGATAAPLLALLLAWGRQGIAERLERCMAAAAIVGQFIANHPQLLLLQKPESGVVVWRHRSFEAEALLARLPTGLASLTRVGEQLWLRCVAANPMLDPPAVMAAIDRAA